MRGAVQFCQTKPSSRRNSHIFEIQINKENEFGNGVQLRNKERIKKVAMEEYIQERERSGMLKEDLSGKLLQRAELIGECEELEEVLDQFRRKNKFEWEFAGRVERLEQEMSQIRRQQPTRLSEAISDLIREREHSHKLLQERIQEETVVAFKSYVEQQSIKYFYQGSKFRNIRQTYGEQVYEQSLQDHKKQIEGIIQSQYSKRIQQIILALRNHNRVELLIHNNMIYVDNTLTNELVESQNYLKNRKQDDIYKELLNSDQRSSSQKKNNRSYTEINQKKQQIRQISTEKSRPTTTRDDSLHFSQIVDSCINPNDTSKGSSVCQLSADDSLLQHFNELNMSIIPKQKHLNMPLQPQDRHYLQDTVTNNLLRLQTIQEEQLSTKREQSKMFEKQEEIRQCKQQLMFNQTQSTTHNSQIESCSKEATKPTVYIPLFFNLQSNPPSNPATVKNANRPLYFQQQPVQISSEQGFKHQKSRSFDSTAHKDQQRRLFIQEQSNTSSHNSNNINTTINTNKQSQSSVHLIPMENDILKLVKPLQNGLIIYKKFPTNSLISRQEFDPLQHDNPTSLGYGSRIIQLSPSLDLIEFRNQLKINVNYKLNQVVDSSVTIENIMRTIIPKQVQILIAIKKKINGKLILSPEEKLVAQIIHWPMQIITKSSGRVDLLFEDECQLEQWQRGIMFLKDNQKTLQQIARKLKKT